MITITYQDCKHRMIKENALYRYIIEQYQILGPPHSTSQKHSKGSTPDHLLLDSAPNRGALISRWEINKFKNC